MITTYIKKEMFEKIVANTKERGATQEEVQRLVQKLNVKIVE